jgi:hypothetical protein
LADPYATTAPDLSGRPDGPPSWADAVAERGGEEIGSADLAAADGFTYVHCRGVGTLAPIARLDPPLAVLLWLEHSRESVSVPQANRALAALRTSERPLYAIKQGWIGGPAERPGCLEVGGDMIEAVLDAAAAGTARWERDPDFGYEVPALDEGLDAARARSLMPRLHYADHDRVYEHAGLVAAKKRERHALAAALPGVDPAIVAASGWPPAPTAGSWRD